MEHFQLTYSRFSETSILVEWPQNIAPEILDDVLTFKNYLLKKHGESLVQVIHAYCSIIVVFDKYIDDLDTAVRLLKSAYGSRQHIGVPLQKLWKIPVCYDLNFALDLEELAHIKKLSIQDVIHMHSAAIYKVYFIGFLPGFLYLGGLDKRLFMPRRKSPRQRIDRGAVGIGGRQTGVYPNASPGGWNIIGNSPISFFNSKLEQPCFASAGDCIQFVPVDLETYQMILTDVNDETYKLESEVLDG